jgi:hypothetical protein
LRSPEESAVSTQFAQALNRNSIRLNPKSSQLNQKSSQLNPKPTRLNPKSTRLNPRNPKFPSLLKGLTKSVSKADS